MYAPVHIFTSLSRTTCISGNQPTCKAHRYRYIPLYVGNTQTTRDRVRCLSNHYPSATSNHVSTCALFLAPYSDFDRICRLCRTPRSGPRCAHVPKQDRQCVHITGHVMRGANLPRFCVHLAHRNRAFFLRPAFATIFIAVPHPPAPPSACTNQVHNRRSVQQPNFTSIISHCTIDMSPTWPGFQMIGRCAPL